MNGRSQTPTEGISRKDHFLSKNGSPPRTPSRRRRDPPSSYPKSAKLAAATGSTYVDDATAYERDSATDDDVEDPHDLTYSSKHFPRASMVDNMVLALDQFSHPTAEPANFYNDDARTYRARGHTFSSSVSSESDIRSLQAKSTASTQRLPRRSSARYARDPSQLPSIFGEDEDSTRVRIYDAQRAAPPAKLHKQMGVEDHSKGNTSISSVDLSHLKHLQGRLGPAGNRRSQSFDFGSRRRTDEEETNDTAPHPVIFSGPKAQRQPVSTTFDQPTMERRGSTKSARAARNKPSTLGTSAVHGTPAPAVGTANTTTPSDKKSPSAQPPEPHSAPRSGLFKRFFGSSKNAAPNPTTPQQPNNAGEYRDAPAAGTAAARLHKQSHKDSVDISNKENIHPTITKKPSSFFRRRKKSVSTTPAPPPMPLTLATGTTQTDSKPGEPSPVSSLKAFMDPYLTDDHPSSRAKSPTSPMRSFYMPAQESAGTGISRTESPEPVRQPRRHAEKLTVPQKETFLTDSSSCEDVDHSQASDVEFSDHTKKSDHSSHRTTPRASSTMPTPATIRPVIDNRSSSWHSERLSVPPRKDSLVVDTSKYTAQPVRPPASQRRNTSGSDVSDYKSAPSTPMEQTNTPPVLTSSPRLHVSHPSIGEGPTLAELDKAQHLYNNGEEDMDGNTAAAWLGEAGSDRERVRRAYMVLFDFTNHTILAALRYLCSRLVLKAESQLIDRILDVFSKRWCSCNPNHGFKSADVVHTICYSILLLNTDLHMADIGSKMTRSQFVKNSMQTIRPVAAEDDSNPATNQLLTVRSSSFAQPGTERISVDRESCRAVSSLGHRPNEHLVRTDSSDLRTDGINGPLVEAPFSGSRAGWELQIEGVLKDIYYSIQKEPLPLFGSEPTVKYPPSASNSNLLSLSGLRRTPSVLSKQSESNRSRYGDSKSLSSKWNSKGRSRPRLGSTPGFGSSKNSLEDQSSAWSPSMSSTWSKASLGKTLTSMSVDSFATNAGFGNDYQSSIGFANALSQAIIREDQMETHTDDGMKAVPLLEDESLELEGAPWAKEGILKHKCHLEGVDKRSRDRNWNDCFAVIEKGWMRLFSFSVTAKSLRTKARNQKQAGAVVGGGNWQDNAEEVWKFMLRHTIASSLPPPGYSKQRPHVWALSLPTGAVHLFSVGTPDIVKEFVSTANYWSARLSKEPMIGGVTSMEYGWSDSCINRALTGPDVRPSFASNDMARPSTQMSIRSSMEQAASVRPKLHGDRVHISDWAPPTQSLLASQLLEVDQLKALQTYVQNIEEELQKHNELRSAMVLAFSPKHSNYSRAMGNWEKKSSYLLREIVKFKNYIDALQGAQHSKERIYKTRQAEERQRQADDDSMALYTSVTMSSTGT